MPLPNDADIKRLVEKSDRLFIFATTALRYIGDEFAADPEIRFKVILGDNVMYKSSPYSGLDTLYWTILDKAVPASHDALEEIATRFQFVVGTIVTLRDPLPLPSPQWLSLREMLIRLFDIYTPQFASQHHPVKYHAFFIPRSSTTSQTRNDVTTSDSWSMFPPERPSLPSDVSS